MIFFRTLVSFLKNEDYRDLLITTFITLGFGSVVYHFLEGWDWIDSIYFSVITLTTVGYGDYSPQTAPGKVFTIFYIVIGIGIILSFINTVYNHYNNVKTDDKDRKKKRYKRRRSSSSEKYKDTDYTHTDTKIEHD
jgi:voltage-gated potassium channel